MSQPGQTSGSATPAINPVGQGDASSYGHFLDDVEEYKSASGYALSGGSAASYSNKHTVGVHFKLVSATWPTGAEEFVYYSWIAVAAGTELRSSGSVTPWVGTTSWINGGATTVMAFPGTHEVWAQVSSTGALSGTQRLQAWRVTSTWTKFPGVPGVASHNVEPFDLDLTRLSCSDASVDTRHGYGQPNREGQIPADPNAEYRPMNFGNWLYKGGLFVGYMPDMGKDRSGLSRTQLWVNGGSAFTSGYRFASLILFDLGKPKDPISGTADIGVYVPDSGGSETESSVNWNTKWTIDPQGYSSTSTDFDTNPISYRSFSGSGTNDYISFRLFRGDGGGSTVTKPSNALSFLNLAMLSESSVVSSYSSLPWPNPGVWRYFASNEYEAEATSFPANASAPHVWVVTDH